MKTTHAFIFLLLLMLSIACSEGNSSQQTTNSPFKAGIYTHASFQSTQRGKVDYNVYLPPNWSKDAFNAYPLIVLLHGQGEDEYTFLNALPADSLNSWMNQQLIPETIIIALRGGKNTNDMQWYTNPNEVMITSNEQGELRDYASKQFNTSMNSAQISVIGHSRGATGALNFALYFPSKFASVVSSAFVSDYAIDRLKQAAHQNLNQILKSGVQIKMLIGNKDQYVLNNNRKGSPIMNRFLNQKGIPNTLQVIPNKTHRLHELWEYPTNLNYLQFCSKSWKK